MLTEQFAHAKFVQPVRWKGRSDGEKTKMIFLYPFLHSPEEVASDPRILCLVMFFPYLSLASLNGLVL